MELVLNTADTAPPLSGWIEPTLSRIAAVEDLSGGRVTVAVVDEPAMRRLHEQYRGSPESTDVLTFDLRNPSGRGAVDADIVVCSDVAARQARGRRHDVRVEILLYAVHGLLHLLGYDDHDPARAEQMHRREDELMAQVGLPAVYGTR